MAMFGTARALASHQEECNRDNEATRRKIDKLEDKIDKLRDETAAEMRRMHGENQTAIKEIAASLTAGVNGLWGTLRWMLGGVVGLLATVLWYVLAHGGLAALLKV